MTINENLMFNYFKQFTEAYYHLWLRLANFGKKASIFPIDFSEHWIHVIGKRKWYLLVSTLCITVIQCFYANYPLILERFSILKALPIFCILWAFGSSLFVLNSYQFTVQLFSKYNA